MEPTHYIYKPLLEYVPGYLQGCTTRFEWAAIATAWREGSVCHSAEDFRPVRTVLFGIFDKYFHMYWRFTTVCLWASRDFRPTSQ